VIGYGIDWTMKGRSGCDKGFKRFEFSRREKTLVLQKAYARCSEPDRVHTHAALLVGCVHTRAALLIGHVPIDRLVSVED
jgi:hypothetical protein